jgi:hypothetical protein
MRSLRKRPWRNRSSSRCPIVVTVTYPGMHPFEGQFPASSPQATIELISGLSLASGETVAKLLPDSSASGASAIVTWNLVASDHAGIASFIIRGEGIVSGSSTSCSSYEDGTGGGATCELEIQPRPGAVPSEEGADYALLAFESCGPNPFYEGTGLRFTLARPEPVRLSIHNACGRPCDRGPAARLAAMMALSHFSIVPAAAEEVQSWDADRPLSPAL